MIDNVEFKVVDKVLTAYSGQGGDVVIPDGVVKISYTVFCECKTLRSVVIPNGVESIALFAFKDCSALEKVVFPSSLKIVGTGAFVNCGSLTEIVLPDGTSEIRDMAFRNCGNLRSVVIPDSVKNLQFVFEVGCPRLERIICGSEAAATLGKIVREKTVHAFWERVRNGTATNAERRGWFVFLEKYARESFSAMRNNVEFYKTVLMNCFLPVDLLTEIIEITDSPECRALLLEYRRALAVLDEQ